MFTSEPSLAQRIERMIGDTPIVDPHSQIRCDQPNAPDLASLMSDHRLRTELIAVGMPPEDFEPALPPDERVRRTIPYLRRSRNTALSWCLFRIFRDLYDFGDSQLTESNYRDLFDKVASTGRDPDWARSVLQDRSNIRAVVTGLNNRSVDPSKDSDYFYYTLNVQDLLCPGLVFDADASSRGRTTRGEYLDSLTALLGESPATTEGLEQLVFEWLDRTVTGRVRFSSTFLPIESRLNPPDETEARAALNHAANGGALSDVEVDALAGLVSCSVLKWHHRHRKAFVFSVGAEYLLRNGQGIPRFQETWTSEMARGFRQFSGVRFGLRVASDLLAHDVAVLAGQFSNVYASGDWWHNFSPMTLEKNLGLRVQVAPATKVVGFVSDAEYAEWGYGKLQVVRKAMAGALARLVEARSFEEDEIPPLLLQILHDTPRDLYDLGDA